MTVRGFLTLAFVGLLLPGAARTSAAQPPSGSQSQGPVKVATIDPSRVFNEMQETKDLRQKMALEGQRLMAQEKERREEIEALQQSRAQFKPDHPQHEEINRKLTKAVVEFKNWRDFTTVDAERNQKRQLRQLFERMQAAVAEVAQRDGIDVVVSSAQPEIPDDLEQVKYDDLRRIINQRTLLYASAKADISDEVLALLDAKYKAAGGGAARGAGAPGGVPEPAGARSGAGTGGVNAAPAGAGAPRRQQP